VVVPLRGVEGAGHLHGCGAGAVLGFLGLPRFLC
jgi:hypothetical protein